MSSYSQLGSERIALLHVDDSDQERQLVKQAISLTQIPFDFYEADSLESAIPFFQIHWHDEPRRSVRPSIILLDYDLGDHTGADFLYWLRVLKKNASTPVVMLSGSVGQPHVAECYATGANYFLSKPNSLVRLKAIVRMLYATTKALPHSTPLSLLPEFVPDPRSKL